jgi:hypothetical protein
MDDGDLPWRVATVFTLSGRSFEDLARIGDELRAMCDANPSGGAYACTWLGSVFCFEREEDAVWFALANEAAFPA